MEPGGSMPYSQGLSNNLYPELIQPNSSYWYLGFPKSLFPVGLPVKMLKALLPSSILATWPAHFNLLDLITLNILGERYKLWSSCLCWYKALILTKTWNLFNWWLIGVLLVSRSGLVEEDVIEVSHYYGFHLSFSSLDIKFKVISGKIIIMW